MVVHNERMVQLKGALTQQYWPFKVLLDFSVQPLMLGKVTIVRGVVLYPLGVTIDFWEETTYY
jgi:hypothetical protein